MALKLAQGEVLRDRGNKEPVYLIDDVFGELDPLRRNALMEKLPKEVQRLITTANLDWWKQGGASLPVMEVNAGAVTPRD